MPSGVAWTRVSTRITSLVLLFIKYVSDKYAGQPYGAITVPAGASFADMVALKGKTDIGDQINKKIIAPLAKANDLPHSDMPDFNDSAKLGDGKEKVDRLTDLISIFQNPALDFSKNRAEGDDIMGDAYEYLMRHFATESGKSKGQFYTPAEVSRVMAAVIGIAEAHTTPQTTVYDPTCGSGSLLIKVADAAAAKVTLYGQEKDATTAGLARMNVILHNFPTAQIVQGNTLADPKFVEGHGLRQFDYVVANPPFSDKRWSIGLHPNEGGTHSEAGLEGGGPRDYGRFEGFGIPPAKQGDYAYLLHILRSLKSTGSGACILPHGVLFRGNAEGEIRKRLIQEKFVKAIIGLPANLFYGTGIPACIVVLDKLHHFNRQGIFMIDASAGFMKDGPKNRLRAQDIHRIVDVFRKEVDVPGYARMVSLDEIAKNDFNLNLPRYIDSQRAEDRHDIEGHLRGGIPAADIEALHGYWEVCPTLKTALFKDNRPGYQDLAIGKEAIKVTIHRHTEYVTFMDAMGTHFATWRDRAIQRLKTIESGCHPKEIIRELSEDLLAHYTGQPLIDAYDVYQHLMGYWADTMQDDAYLISASGWKAEVSRILVKTKNKRTGKEKEVDKGWTCDLVPKELVIARYFEAEQSALEKLEARLETVSGQFGEIEEEHGGEDGLLSELEKISKASVATRLKQIKTDKDSDEERAVLQSWQKLNEEETTLKRQVKDAEAKLDALALAQYPKLTPDDVKSLVVEDKWLAALESAIHGEMDRISQGLTHRVKELAERYETPLPQLAAKVEELEAKVSAHLEKMGFTWN